MFPPLNIGKVFGIPMRLHWTFYTIVPIWIISNSASMARFQELILIVIALSISVLLHEIGHCILALKNKCPVSEIILTPIGGIAKLTRLPDDPREEIQIAIAGPLVSLFLGVSSFFMLKITAMLGIQLVTTLLFILFIINTALLLFNLIPAFPMDGGRVFRAYLSNKKGRLEATRIAAKAGNFFAILFGIYGLFNGHYGLVFIAIFLFVAANAEYKSLQLQEHVNRFTGTFTEFDTVQQEKIRNTAEGFSVSPAPYAPEEKETKAPPSILISETIIAAKELFNTAFRKNS